MVDLRGPGGRADHEAEIVGGWGDKYVNVPLSGLKAFSDEQVAKLLGIIEDSGSGPVFVHCRRGADRTGTILAHVGAREAGSHFEVKTTGYLKRR